MPDSLAMILVICVCSVVQTLFGVGLLVFGTPTLLLLGLPYADILGVLLPCSVALSTSQALAGPRRLRGITYLQFTCCAAAIVLGLSAFLLGYLMINLELAVAALLFLHAFVRCWPAAVARVYATIRRHPLAYVGGMSLVHGLSNMGGGLLTLFASSLTHDKGSFRAVVARFYMVFGLAQISVLCVLGGHAPLRLGLALVPVVLLTSWLVGERSYRGIGEAAYQRAFTCFIAAYGLALLGKAAIQAGLLS